MENKSQNLTEMSRKYRFGLLILDFHKKDQMENHFCNNIYRKDAESLNATSLAVIAGMKNYFLYV